MKLLRLRYVAGSGAGLVAKTSAVLFFAWRFPPEAYASLVQVQAQTALWVLIAGLDLYVFFCRRWVHGGRLIPKDELILFIGGLGLAYVVILPIIWALSSMNPVHTALLIGVIVTEHLSQELNRLLLSFERHLQGMTTQLLRNFSWVVVFIGISLCTHLQDPLTAFLGLWICGGLAAMVTGCFFVRRLLGEPSGIAPQPLFQEAVKVIGLSLATTIAHRALLTGDRLVAVATMTSINVSAYGMYVTVGAGALAVADIGVIAFAQPRVLYLLQPQSGPVDRSKARTTMLRSMLQAGLVCSVVGLLGWGFIAATLDASFSAHPMAFVVVQCAYVFLAMTHGADGVLYALGRFGTVLKLTVVASIFFGLGLFAVWALNGGPFGLALSVAVALGFLFAAKLAVAAKCL